MLAGWCCGGWPNAGGMHGIESQAVTATTVSHAPMPCKLSLPPQQLGLVAAAAGANHGAPRQNRQLHRQLTSAACRCSDQHRLALALQGVGSAKGKGRQSGGTSRSHAHTQQGAL